MTPIERLRWLGARHALLFKAARVWPKGRPIPERPPPGWVQDKIKSGPRKGEATLRWVGGAAGGGGAMDDEGEERTPKAPEGGGVSSPTAPMSRQEREAATSGRSDGAKHGLDLDFSGLGDEEMAGRLKETLGGLDAKQLKALHQMLGGALGSGSGGRGGRGRRGGGSRVELSDADMEQVDALTDSWSELKESLDGMDYDEIAGRMKPFRDTPPHVLAEAMRQIGAPVKASHARNVQTLTQMAQAIKSRMNDVARIGDKPYPKPSSSDKAKWHVDSYKMFSEKLAEKSFEDIDQFVDGLRSLPKEDLYALMEHLEYPRPSSKAEAARTLRGALRDRKALVKVLEAIEPDGDSAEGRARRTTERVRGHHDEFKQFNLNLRDKSFEDIDEYVDRLGQLPKDEIDGLMDAMEYPRQPSKAAALRTLKDSLRHRKSLIKVVDLI